MFEWFFFAFMVPLVGFLSWVFHGFSAWIFGPFGTLLNFVLLEDDLLVFLGFWKANPGKTLGGF